MATATSERRSHRVDLELLERGDLRQALARQRLGAGTGREFQGLDQVLIGGGRLPKGAKLEQAGADNRNLQFFVQLLAKMDIQPHKAHEYAESLVAADYDVGDEFGDEFGEQLQTELLD